MATQETRRVRLASSDAVPEGAGTVIKTGDLALALFRVEGRCYALSNTCPHRGGPLGEGDLEGFVVHCPWHGWAWDVRTGVNVRQASMKVACFALEEVGGEVFVELEAAEPGT